MAEESPQAIAYPPSKGGRRKWRWKTASRSAIPFFQYPYAIVSWYRSVSSASDGLNTLTIMLICAILRPTSPTITHSLPCKAGGGEDRPARKHVPHGSFCNR